MALERFEEQPVWRKAIELAVKTYTLTEQADFRGHGSLRDQIERAAVSVSTTSPRGSSGGRPRIC